MHGFQQPSYIEPRADLITGVILWCEDGGIMTVICPGANTVWLEISCCRVQGNKLPAVYGC